MDVDDAVTARNLTDRIRMSIATMDCELESRSVVIVEVTRDNGDTVVHFYATVEDDECGSDILVKFESTDFSDAMIGYYPTATSVVVEEGEVEEIESAGNAVMVGGLTQRWLRLRAWLCWTSKPSFSDSSALFWALVI